METTTMKNHRSSRGYSPRSFAHEIGVSYRTVLNWIRRGTVPRGYTIDRLPSGRYRICPAPESPSPHAVAATVATVLADRIANAPPDYAVAVPDSLMRVLVDSVGTDIGHLLYVLAERGNVHIVPDSEGA